MFPNEEGTRELTPDTMIQSKGDASSSTTKCGGLSRKRQRRRKLPACRRCHVRKVKCSGGQPCDNCRIADNVANCSYPRMDKLVKFSQEFVNNLIAENQRLRGRDTMTISHQATNDLDITITPSDSQAEVSSPPQGAFLEERPWLFEMDHLSTILIGNASDAAFAMHFCRSISEREHTHISLLNYPPDEELLVLSNRDCPWPTPSRARLLVNIALKLINRDYHIVRHSQILEGLENTIQDPDLGDFVLKQKLWALLAIGEIYLTRTATQGRDFPGIAYFAQASRTLRVISERPRIDAIEIILLLSFYSLALNRHHTAYALASSSLRLSIVAGLHLNVPKSQLTDAGAREHRIRLWWTAYSFDRLCASRLGFPASISNDSIEIGLPSDVIQGSLSDRDFTGASYLIARIQLTRLLGLIIDSVYASKSQQRNLLDRVQESLVALCSFKEQLPPSLNMHCEDDTKLNPETLSLHLYLNQVAIIATRPVLLQVLKAGLNTLDHSITAEHQIPAVAITLSEACVHHARTSCQLLIECWIDGSFATFDFSYTQYLFAASTILAISSLLQGLECWSNEDIGNKDTFESAAQFLTQQKETGNLAAEEYCRHLDDILACITTLQSRRGELTIPDGNLQRLDGDDTTRPKTDYESSLSEFWSPPGLDLQFADDSLQGLYPPDISPESQTANC